MKSAKLDAFLLERGKGRNNKQMKKEKGKGIMTITDHRI
jgi:hypothetical protein